MSTASRPNASAAQRHRSAKSALVGPDNELSRWGGSAGLIGVMLLVASVVVVVALDLPDASDVETLTDFADIESGRIAEHFLYLGALVGFALHVAVMHRLLRRTHPAASLFGAVLAEFGLIIMAASSLLHVSTSPLAELYTDPEASAGDRNAIEYAWHGAQSVFDTMLATGVLLVPLGIMLLGVAMLRTTAFGSTVSIASLVLGAVGAVGAVIAVVDPGSAFAAASVFAIALFHLIVGWRTLTLGDDVLIDLTAGAPAL